MKRPSGLWLPTFLGGLLLIGAVLVSCAPDTSAPELPAKTPVALLVEDQNADAAAADTGDAADVLVSASNANQTCLNCHTNEQILRTLAVEEEKAESLSSGPG